jgi:hypothetical protein
MAIEQKLLKSVIERIKIAEGECLDVIKNEADLEPQAMLCLLGEWIASLSVLLEDDNV